MFFILDTDDGRDDGVDDADNADDADTDDSGGDGDDVDDDDCIGGHGGDGDDVDDDDGIGGHRGRRGFFVEARHNNCTKPELERSMTKYDQILDDMMNLYR